MAPPWQACFRWLIIFALTHISCSSESSGTIKQADAANGTCSEDTSVATEHEPCVDKLTKCEAWASNGECDENVEFMQLNCQKACGICEDKETVVADVAETEKEDEACVDKLTKCETWASKGECDENVEFMRINCRRACGICIDMGIVIDLGEEQEIDPSYEQKIRELLESADHYLRTVVATDPKQKKLLEGCKLHHKNCAFWAAIGECDANPKYMQQQCAPVCHSCEQLSIDTRCPVDLETMPNAWKPGDLNEFFTNITTMEEYQKYTPRVLSRPRYVEGDDHFTADYKLGPWVVTMENFVSEEEALRLIELGALEGYERSTDVGEVKFDGTFEKNVNNGRTSKNSWCVGECYNDPIAQRVIQRVTELSNLPEENSENLQLLKYDVGQYYRTHHDYIDFLRDRQQGVRIMTIYLYLNDVEEGGGTNFPGLNLTVQPKRGRILIWPSVKNEDPDEKDIRTSHQALPVKKGVKYGANAWVHMRDFKTPNSNGCGSG